MDSVLRPRDIQTRIRSGESPETVAAAAQTSVDKIMGFAVPVLAERAYIAEQALKASVRRRAGDGPIGHLAEAVAERLRARDIDPESVTWDSWRRDDGRWTLTADHLSGESALHAVFVYDVGGRYVMADDDESRWLVGERSTGHVPQPGSSAPTSSAPRPLASVDQQLPLGDDAIELVTGRPPEPLHPEEATVDLTETASSVRSAVPPASSGPDPVSGPGADWIATQASERPPTQEPAPASGSDVPPVDRTADEPADGPAGTGPEGLVADLTEERADEPADTLFSGPRAVEAEATAASEPQEAPSRRSGKPRRASVPSWDEIMFGSDKNS